MSDLTAEPVNAFLQKTYNTSNYSETTVVELLRLSVPKKDLSSWLAVEKVTWQPWLELKEGFLDRELLWDPKNEEGILLIRWESYKKWKSIPTKEIDAVQTEFEYLARKSTGKTIGNPFPLVSENELIPNLK